MRNGEGKGINNDGRRYGGRIGMSNTDNEGVWVIGFKVIDEKY